MEIKKVSWNAAQGLIFELSNRRAMANTYFIRGNIKTAFNTLVSIKQSVVQSFNDEERKKLAEYENNFGKISPALSLSVTSSFNSKYKKISMLAYKVSKELYSEYNNILMDLLEKYGYLIGEKEDSSIMKF